MRFLILAILFSVSTTAFSQQNYFLYLQSDNRQPFYVKIGEDLYSASSAGYAIIPKLQKKTYNVQIGFPKNEYPLQTFSVDVLGDAGYTIKNFGENGWALFDILTLTTIASNSVKYQVIEKEDKSNGFANVLANATNNPDLTITTVEVKPKVKPAAAEKEERVTAVKPVEKKVQEVSKTQDETKNLPAVKEKITATTHTGVNRLNSILTVDGRSLSYSVTDEGGNKDTVVVFIPYKNVTTEAIASDNSKVPELSETALEPKPISANQKANATVAKVEKEKPTKKVTELNRPFLDIEINNPNAAETRPQEAEENKKSPLTSEKQGAATPVKVAEKTKKEATAEKKRETTPRLQFNSDCVKLATADDFLALRSKMASEKDESGMRYAAVKDFKQRCYSTEQVKNLSLLFLTQKGKYDFFDEAYPFVNDSNNFPSLVQELTDAYYVKRFKAMVEL